NVPANYSALFYPPVACNNKTIAQAGQSIYISRNSGSAWTEVALPAGLTATALYLATTDLLIVGTTNGRLFRATWNGSAWQAVIELSSPRSAWISGVYADPSNTNRLWATSSWVG